MQPSLDFTAKSFSFCSSDLPSGIAILCLVRSQQVMTCASALTLIEFDAILREHYAMLGRPK